MSLAAEVCMEMEPGERAAFQCIDCGVEWWVPALDVFQSGCSDCGGLLALMVCRYGYPIYKRPY